MQKFELTVFNQRRIISGILLVPIGFMGFIVLGAEMGSYALSLGLLVLLVLLVVYAARGNLTITFENQELHFKWTKKYFFNFKEIAPVLLPEITAIVLDNEQFLRKIKTADRTISINTTKLKPRDASKFIGVLSAAKKKYGILQMDSWDPWLEKGFLKKVFWVQTGLLIVLPTLLIISVAKGIFGFNVLVVLFILPQQILYWFQVKEKLKTERTRIQS
jgi:hypothetical protein